VPSSSGAAAAKVDNVTFEISRDVVQVFNPTCLMAQRYSVRSCSSPVEVLLVCGLGWDQGTMYSAGPRTPQWQSKLPFPWEGQFGGTSPTPLLRE